MWSGYNRAGARTPMQWDTSPNAGFPPPRPRASTCRSIPTRTAPPSPGSGPTENSLLHLVRDLIALRRASP